MSVSIVFVFCSPVEMVVIGDLSAHTQYDLSVQTHTNNAIGLFSSVVKCRTEEGSKWNYHFHFHLQAVFAAVYVDFTLE